MPIQGNHLEVGQKKGAGGNQRLFICLPATGVADEFLVEREPRFQVPLSAVNAKRT